MHFRDAGDEAGPPFRNGEMVSSPDQAFVEQGKTRPFCGCGVLIGGDGVYFTGAADEFADSECEFIPTDTAFIAVVVEAGDERELWGDGWDPGRWGGDRDDVKDGGGEIGGVGR